MITITFATWIIPTVITLVSLFWAMYIVDDGPGYMSGISNLFALIPALFISCVSWMLWGFLK